MEPNNSRTKASVDADELEQRTQALDKHIEEARAVSSQAEPDAGLPFAVGDFNDDSSDGPGGEGVTPETNYTSRGD